MSRTPKALGITATAVSGIGRGGYPPSGIRHARPAHLSMLIIVVRAVMTLVLC